MVTVLCIITKGFYIVSVTKAHMRASAKYDKEHYLKFQTNLKIADFEEIDLYCKTNGISKAQLIIRMFNYCKEHNIDLTKDNVNSQK